MALEVAADESIGVRVAAGLCALLEVSDHLATGDHEAAVVDHLAEVGEAVEVSEPVVNDGPFFGLHLLVTDATVALLSDLLGSECGGATLVSHRSLLFGAGPGVSLALPGRLLDERYLSTPRHACQP